MRVVTLSVVNGGLSVALSCSNNLYLESSWQGKDLFAASKLDSGCQIHTNKQPPALMAQWLVD